MFNNAMMNQLFKKMVEQNIRQLKGLGYKDCKDLGHQKCPPQECELCVALRKKKTTL